MSLVKKDKGGMNKAAKLISKELLGNHDFMAALAVEIIRAAQKKKLNKHVTELIAENKIMFTKGGVQ